MDLLVRGGTIVTMDATRRVVSGDVLVRDGAIVGVGEVDRGGRPARVLDARGCAVIPGFVQAHVHLCQVLFRGAADGRPLLAWLKERIWPLEGAHDPDSLYVSAQLGLAEMIRGGTTTILDMGTVHHQDAVFRAMHDAGIRGASGKTMMDRGKGVPSSLREATKDSLRESERLCAAWHGKSGRLHYAFAPRFVLSCSETLLRRTAELAREANALLHTHAAEHAEEREAVRAALGVDDIVALRSCGIAGPRTVLAHGVQLRAAEMRTIAREGTRFVHCPSANLKLASGIAPIVAMRAAGILVALGADGAPCNNRLDAFTEMRLAAIIHKPGAGPRAVPARVAFDMATMGGARAVGLADRIGSIEVGKRADLVVIQRGGAHVAPIGRSDPFSQLVYAHTAADVRDVLVDGRAVVRDRTLTTGSVPAITAEAERQIDRLFVRLGRAT